MKRRNLLLFVLIPALLIAGTTTVFSDEITENVVSVVLEDFDDPEYQWVAVGSKFIDENLLSYKLVNTSPEALYVDTPMEERKALGIRAGFRRKGYNNIEIFRVEGEGEDAELKPIPIPGRAKNIDMWVWGSNYDYYLEAHFRDYKGMVHVIPFGSIRYEGWKNMRINIPNSMPQSRSYLPKYRQLELTKLVLWTK